MTFLQWWLVGVSCAGAFHFYALWSAWRFSRRREHKLNEIHGMLVTLTERDPDLRVALLQAAVRERLSE